jgi:hypothetical protein
MDSHDTSRDDQLENAILGAGIVLMILAIAIAVIVTVADPEMHSSTD